MQIQKWKYKKNEVCNGSRKNEIGIKEIRNGERR